MKNPNILYIVVDQLSANMLSCNGNKYVSTPNIDNLSNEGINFKRTYCSNPVCIPSRFSLFTGMPPEFVRLRSNDLRDFEKPSDDVLKLGLANQLNSNGYECYYGGKEHFPKYKAEDIGFKVITNDEREELSFATDSFLKEDHEKPWMMVSSFINPHDICYKALSDYFKATNKDFSRMKNSNEYKTMNKYNKVPNGFSKEEFLNNICPDISKNHLPQENEPEIINEFLEQRSFKKYVADNYKEFDWRLHKYIYKKLTEEVDREIGIVLKSLKESKYANNTIVVFTSDHGDMDGSHRLEHKTVLYEEAINIPLIISYPGHLPENISSDNLCSNSFDLYKTLLDYVGVEVPKENNGVNIIKGMDDIKERRIYVPIESELGRCIVSKDFKYVKYDYGNNNEQLYDYIVDPLEMSNHIDNKENKSILTDLKSEFARVWNDDAIKENKSPLLLYGNLG